MDWVFFGASVLLAFLASINTFIVVYDLLTEDTPWIRIVWNAIFSLAAWAFSLLCLMMAMAITFDLIEVGSK